MKASKYKKNMVITRLSTLDGGEGIFFGVNYHTLKSSPNGQSRVPFSNSWSILEEKKGRPVWEEYLGVSCWCPTVQCIVIQCSVYYGVIRVYCLVSCIVCNSHQYNFNKYIYSVDNKVVFFISKSSLLLWSWKIKSIFLCDQARPVDQGANNINIQ